MRSYNHHLLSVWCGDIKSEFNFLIFFFNFGEVIYFKISTLSFPYAILLSGDSRAWQSCE
jgi:hypothetical protein